MTKKEYNGWHNYETWLVALWLDNDGYAEILRDEAAKYVRLNQDPTTELADSMKERMQESNPLGDQASFWADLLNGALSEVNWFEIASHYIDEVNEELKAEQDEEDEEAAAQ